MLPIGEKLSSRPFHISDSRPTSPFSAQIPREKDTQKDTLRPTSPVHPGPLTTTTTLFVRGANVHNLLVRLVYQPSPERPRTYRTRPDRVSISLSEFGRPKLRVLLFHPSICNRSWHRMPLWGSSLPLMTALVPPRPRNQIRLPTFVGCTHACAYQVGSYLSYNHDLTNPQHC